MEITELLRSSMIVNIELHVCCLIICVLLFLNMRSSFTRNGRRKELELYAIYFGSILMVVSDCIWITISALGNTSNAVAYVVNLVYFIGSATGAFFWFAFSTKELETRVSTNKYIRAIATVPYILVITLYLLSPFFGFIFSVKDGVYIRGSLFYLDPIVKMGYIGAASIIAIVCGTKKDIGYLRKKDFDFALFGVPVIICGIIQTITGVDFNCLGVTGGLVLIYIVGISNKDNENIDVIFSLANSFEASYIVNIDTGVIRPLHKDRMHDREIVGMKSRDYTTHFYGVLSTILVPEDRKSTLEAFDINNVEKRLEIQKSFSIRYRVKEHADKTSIHTAFFVRAAGFKGKNEFLVGINNIDFNSLIHERNEVLSHDNQNLEQINTSIIESVAKIVEARDGGSGAHIVRVKKLTEILAQDIMKNCPEYMLDDDKVKLISSASVLHDVGKIVIPDSILLKPGRLTDDEFEIMKTHSTKGCDILNMFPLGLDDAFLGYALSICRWHHEKYDGKGYPDGLKGEDIPIAAQIVSVADCFDALVSDRPYKKAYSPEKALEMILNGECGQFSPEIINALQAQQNKLKELVRLYA